MQMLFVPGEITTRERCSDRIEPLIKYPANPVLRAEHEWEGEGIYYPSVLYSESKKLFEMWYLTMVGSVREHEPARPLVDNTELDGMFFVCYACSQDGLHWEKPNLGRIKIQGSTNNNIVLTDSGFFLGVTTVIEDLDDPDPNRRYKLLTNDNDGQGREGVRTAISPNGIDWQWVGAFPVLPTQDTPSLWHNRQHGEYVAFLKSRLDNRRARMIAVSKDFDIWSEPNVLLAPDLGDPPTVQFYHQNAFYHAGHIFGLLNRYDVATQRGDIELITSSRGTDWRRLPSRPQVLAPGDLGAWDGGMVLPGQGEPIIRDGKCWCYYYGTGYRHDDSYVPGEEPCRGAIGIATFTPGRMVGQQFEGEGWFTSKPFRCPGGQLLLDARTTHPIQVEVSGAGYGGSYLGYTCVECIQVQGDRQDHIIRWESHADLDALRGQFITLRVYGKNSVVYGARFI